MEALSERTGTSTTWVNKNGSLAPELIARAVRFTDEATGEWRDVDLDLVRGADGTVEPIAHPGGLRLAGKSGNPAKSLKAAQQAKATDLVTLGEGDQQVTLQWKGGLPEDRAMRGGNHRPPYKKGPGSIYNKVRKYLSRN